VFVYKRIREQLLEERRKSARLEAALVKTNADVEYIAMMTDVEIDDEDEEMEVQEDGDQ